MTRVVDQYWADESEMREFFADQKRRIAELEEALAPFADYADHVADDPCHEVVRHEYADGTFGAVFGSEFHRARRTLHSGS